VDNSTVLEPILRLLHEHLPVLREEFWVSSLRVFGSYVRSEQTTSSDVDILVNYEELPGLFKFIELELHLSELLGRKVDLVLEDSLKPKIGERILAEAVPV